jgi:hypothetical protein
MASRYNSPPNWPQPPPGWVPPPDWQPDPSWGPPPAGHQFWVDDQTLAQPEQWQAGPPPAPSQPPYQPSYQPGQPSGPPPQGPRSRGWLIAVAVIVAVLVAGGGTFAVVQLVSNSDTTSGSEQDPTVSDDTTPVEPTDTTLTDPGETTPVEPSDGTDTTVVTQGTLALGQSGQVAGYNVTLTGFTIDADKIIADENPFNEKPTNQYMLATFTAQYSGPGKGTLYEDLRVTLVGSDEKEYESYTCTAVVPDDMFTASPVKSGATATAAVCFDVPPSIINGATFFIEDFSDFSGNPDRVTWSVG